MRSYTAALFVALFLVPSAAAAYQPAPSEPVVRQAHQEEYILDAAHDGRISVDQQKTLMAQQAEVLSYIERFSIDGKLSEREREVLAYHMDKASRGIDRAIAAQRANPAPVRTAKAGRR